MPYNEDLARRLRDALKDIPGIIEKKMFGGIGFILNGNMACGVNRDDLIVRVGPDRFEEALAQPHTRPFDMTGRPMSGWIMVAPEGYASDEALARWIRQGVDFARSLPRK